MLDRHPTPIEAKHVTEVDDLPFTFALLGTEVIQSATMSCTVHRGSDSTPAALLSGLPVISGAQVVQRVQGGVAGTVYTLCCQITTSSGRQLVAAAHLPVVDVTAVWS